MAQTLPLGTATGTPRVGVVTQAARASTRPRGEPAPWREPAADSAPAQALSMSFSRALLVGCTRSLTTAPLTLATMICPTSS